MKWFVLPLIVLLSGCAPTRYVHKYKNEIDFEKDKYECKLIAEASAANRGFNNHPFIIADEMKKCMTIKYDWKIVQE